jgi:hypothetical protein
LQIADDTLHLPVIPFDIPLDVVAKGASFTHWQYES